MALADGRLHLSAVILLAPHLTEETAGDLPAAAAHRSKSEIEQLLAERFPKPDLPTRLEAKAPLPVQALLTGTTRPGACCGTWSDAVNRQGHLRAVAARPKVSLAPGRFALQLTVSQSTHDKLRYAQALLSHQVPNGELAQVLDRALDALISKLEKRKFAATKRPRYSQPRSSRSARHIPAHVRRAVWQRDQGRCTFVNESGAAVLGASFPEFDHVNPVARRRPPRTCGCAVGRTISTLPNVLSGPSS